MAKAGSSNTRGAQQDFGDRSRQKNLVPLWEFFNDWFSREPPIRAVPNLWRYEELRPLLLEAEHVISAEDAERRVLALENPGLHEQHLATDSLFAGLQLIIPGEIAPSHRHTPAALRFIVEGSGAYTAVSGEKAYMEPGDFIVTPSWTWHEHGNESPGPMVWLDVLDVPLVRFLGAGFSEKYPDREFPERAPPRDSYYRYGRNMRPVRDSRSFSASPVFSYPYAEARELLESLKSDTDWDPHQALMMEYIDPTTGGAAIPTISTYLQLIPPGFATRPYRSTAGTIVAVVEGTGRIVVDYGDNRAVLDYSPRDVCALPGWQSAAIEANEETVLFHASDRVVQERLGLWREERG